jgi:phage FluMu protein Com
MLVPAHLEVKCPKCGKQFNSEEEMLEHHEECTGAKQKRHVSKKKAVLSVAIISILILSLFVVVENQQAIAAIKTADSDGDGLSDWNEVNVYHTNQFKVDSDGGGVNDFQEIYTYELNPSNSVDDNELIAKLPNVTAIQWDSDKVGGFSTENYVNKSLTDPLIQYLVDRSEITWSDNSRMDGRLLVDGIPVWNSSETYVDNAVQPSYYFTHGRNGNCIESTMAELTILKLVGYKAVDVTMRRPDAEIGHVAPEVLIDGEVYVMNFGHIILRAVFYENTGYVPDSRYDPDWYLK